MMFTKKAETDGIIEDGKLGAMAILPQATAVSIFHTSKVKIETLKALTK